MEHNKALEKEKLELNTLINRGVSFEVDDLEVKHKKYLWGLIRRKSIVQVVRKYTIKEPTLATLDRLSAEWIELAIDEELMKADDSMEQSRKMIAKHSRRCARIIAIAVLGTDLWVPSSTSGRIVRYEEDTIRLEEMTDLFARNIKPSQLFQLYTLISAMSNLGDFLNSIRLMSASRTTAPIRIEDGEA